jgi:UDP-glucuronate 4-epimerase
LPATGLRFFTVYGPWGRPDMAPIKFARAISAGQAIDVYNNGYMSRDFTYIDDIVEGVVRVLNQIPAAQPGWTPERGGRHQSSAPYRIFNIGAGRPVGLLDFIQTLECALGIEAKKNFLPMQPGDVARTWASTENLFAATGFSPRVGLQEGVAQFVDWYRDYYGGRG